VGRFEKVETDGTFFSLSTNGDNCGTSRLSGKSFLYLSPARFLPSNITLLKIRLIRVW